MNIQYPLLALSHKLILATLAISLFTACSKEEVTISPAEQIPDIKKDVVARGCVEKGGELLSKKNQSGESFVLCKFPDGTVREVKDLYDE